MSECKRKLNEAEYFLKTTELLFNNQSLDFEFHLNAFLNATRNVAFVMQKEFRSKKGFNEWWERHKFRADASIKRFVELRNISLKERSVKHSLFSMKLDFGPSGLKVDGKKGPTSVESDVLSLEGPIPTHTYVNINDDNGHRRINVPIVHDFSVVEIYDKGTKTVKFDNFIEESRSYLKKLRALVEEVEDKFSS